MNEELDKLKTAQIEGKLKALERANAKAEARLADKRHQAGFLTAKDVCDIISVSKKSGVLSLRLGDLSIEFNQTQKAKAPSQKQRAAETDADVSEPEQPSPYAQTQGERARASLTDDPDLLMVEDPVAYEAMLMEQDEPANEAN